MPTIYYGKNRTFGPDTAWIVDQANDIIEEYQADNLKLTLRQLYYQFVSRDLLPNVMQSYKKLQNIVNDARLAGLMDWEGIEDRTRSLEALATWENPADIVDAAARSFRLDLWADQPYRLEVWIEKDALTGVIEGVCEQLRVPYFAARGYCSQSEAWAAAHERFHEYIQGGQLVRVLYLGDHDPSGLDMSRDLQDRFLTWEGGLCWSCGTTMLCRECARYADVLADDWGAWCHDHEPPGVCEVCGDPARPGRTSYPGRLTGDGLGIMYDQPPRRLCVTHGVQDDVEAKRLQKVYREATRRRKVEEGKDPDHDDGRPLPPDKAAKLRARYGIADADSPSLF